MILCKKEIDTALAYYEVVLDYFNRVLQDAPPGKLLLQDNRNNNQMIHVVKHDDKRKRYGINGNVELQKKLAQKEFAQKAVRILERNIRIMRNSLDKQIPFDLDEILRSMGKAYRALPEEYFFDRNRITATLHLDEEQSVRINRNIEWGKMPYKESMYHAEQKKHRSSRGQYTRSKSELLILEALYRYGIPFHYDEEQRFNGMFIVPDFTFLACTNKLFFWDYLGMMGDAGYAKRNLNKLDNYYDAGLIPGDNIIITFDKGDSMNMATIDAIIRNEIIPKL